jgi:chromosome segregation ATPase
MSEISIPPSLAAADINSSLADSLAKLVDPKERAKIADDIKAHHALNDVEAKKHTDAINLIKQHQSILDETKRTEVKNKQESLDLDKAKKEFETYCATERGKIADKWSDVNTAAQAAKDLHTKAEGMINSVAAREEELRKGNVELVASIKKNDQRTKDLDKEYETVEGIKAQHTELLENVKSTQATIARLAIPK